jgi:hypothetical protein
LELTSRAAAVPEIRQLSSKFFWRDLRFEKCLDIVIDWLRKPRNRSLFPFFVEIERSVYSPTCVPPGEMAADLAYG